MICLDSEHKLRIRIDDVQYACNALCNYYDVLDDVAVYLK